MRSFIKKVFLLINFLFLFGLFNGYCLADVKNNSILNLFCLNNFKEEMLRANIKYEEEIANYTCECYSEEFSENRSHEKAISKCKLETQEKFNL